MNQRIPFLNLSPEINALWDQLNSSIQKVLRSSSFVLGPSVKAFEDDVAAYLGVKHAIAVNSGTDASIIGLRALGIEPEDEVITTPFSFIATAQAISLVGARPVFVDIEPDWFNIDPQLIEEKIGHRTKAILPVHLYGHAADMDPILDIAKRHGLWVLEDVAQAMGGEYKSRKLGTLGDVGAFSFYPTKNLGAFGDGGLIVTNDDRVGEYARMLRGHGSRKKHYSEILGYNSRLDSIQAEILRVKLPYLDRWNEKRRQAADRYSNMLKNLEQLILPTEAPYARHVYHQYTVRISQAKRNLVRQELSKVGIESMVFYPCPLPKHPMYQNSGDSMPVAEQACENVLSLPIWPQISADIQEKVSKNLGRILN